MKRSEVTLDHVIPRSRGGATDERNLVASCARCNRGKASMSLEEFAVQRSAVISPDGRYRYGLVRTLAPKLPKRRFRTVLWVMLNPSTADAMVDDPTIRRCVGFARRWGFGQIAVVNLFAFRATDPDKLLEARKAGIDIVGPDNNAAISLSAALADRIVFAWGAHPGVGSRVEKVRELVRDRPRFPAYPRKAEVVALGFTAAGQPRHPLFVPYEVEVSRIALEPVESLWTTGRTGV